MKEETKDPKLAPTVDNNYKVETTPDGPVVYVREKPLKGNPYKLAIFILSIMVLALLAGVLYLLFCPPAQNSNPTPDDSQASTTCPEQTACEDTLKEETAVKDVVAKIRQAITDLLRENQQDISSLFRVYDMGASYQPENSIVGVPLTKSYGVLLDVRNSAQNQPLYNLVYNYNTVYQTIERTLINAGFTNTNQEFTTASQGPGAISFTNQATGVICSVYPSSADCGYKTWYNQANAELSNTLAKVYQAATEKDAHYLVAEVKNIQDSPIAPYQRIEVAMPGFGAMFYRANPDAEWQFFTEGQDAPLCSAYDTEDLRKAFAGFSCHPSTPGPMETVQP